MDLQVLKPFTDAIAQHVPQTAAWVPMATLCGLLFFGLVMLGKGARYAPYMASLAFLAAGGVGGSYVAARFSTPVWVSAGLGAVTGFVIGLAFFRIWLALLTGACFALVATGVYSATSVWGPLQDYTNRPVSTVTLPESETSNAGAVFSDAWAYLSSHVPNFQTSIWAIVISTAAAGIVFGLLLPKTARAVWAASAGTVFFGSALIGLFSVFAPQANAWLTSIGPWSWGILGGIWGVSLIYNLHDCRDKKPRPLGDDPDAEPAVA